MTKAQRIKRAQAALQKLIDKRFTFAQVARALAPPRSRSLISKAYYGERVLLAEDVVQIEGFARAWK